MPKFVGMTKKLDAKQQTLRSCKIYEGLTSMSTLANQANMLEALGLLQKR